MLAGDADRVIPYQHSERIAAELPDARLVRLPGVGHMPMLEQPEADDEALERSLRAQRRVPRATAPRGPGRRVVSADGGAPPSTAATSRELIPTVDTEPLGEQLGARLGAGDLVCSPGRSAPARPRWSGASPAGWGDGPGHLADVRARPRAPAVGGRARRSCTSTPTGWARRAGDVTAELDDLDLDTDLDAAVVAVEWGRGWPSGWPSGPCRCRCERRDDDVRIATVRRRGTA